MNHRHRPLAGLLLVSLLPSARATGDPPGPPPGSPPSILVVVADDLGVDELAAYGLGGDPAPTPNVDALVARGVLFENAWATPLCSPTRAALQTGRHGFRTGVGYLVSQRYGGPALPRAELTLPEVLDLGTGGAYAHAAFGKWHLGSDLVGGLRAPNEAGYHHFAGSMENLSSYSDWERVVDGVAATSTEYATTRTVDDALAWIASAPAPWLCYVAFHAPHVPFHAPPAHLHSVDLTGVHPDPRQEPRPYYRAMVEALDTELGRLLAAVPADTTVIFLGDNGTPQQVALPAFQPAKGTLQQGGVHVPLVVAGAGVGAPGTRCGALVGAVDVLATVAALAGVDLGAPAFSGLVLDSVDLGPYLADPSLPSRREVLFSELFFPNGETVPQIPTPACGNAATPQEFCQPELGMQGPGSLTLSICDGSPHLGRGALLEIRHAPPHAEGVVIVSASRAPMPAFGGLVLPLPWVLLAPFQADASGTYRDPAFLPHIGYERVYYQAAAEDGQWPGGYTISNVVEVAVTVDTKAVRGSRYKLIVDRLRCRRSLFDLELDPFERADLLAGGRVLAPAELAELARLEQALQALLGSR